MDTNDADTVDALEAADKAVKKTVEPQDDKKKTAAKYEALDKDGNTVQLDDKRRRSTVVNMMDWVHEDRLEQWRKDHPEHLQDDTRTT